MKKFLLALMLLAPMSMFAQKFGHMNSQTIAESMPEFVKAQGDLKAKATQYENELKQMQQELQRKAEEYDKQKSTMNATKQKETEESLQQMYEKINQTRNSYSEQLNKEQQSVMQPLTERVMAAVEKVGKNGGYVFIIDDAMGLPYVSSTLCDDVTEKVKTELNKK